MLGYYMLWIKLILTTWISCGCLRLCKIFWYQCKRDLKAAYFYISSNLPMVISVTHSLCLAGTTPVSGTWEACHYAISSFCLMSMVLYTLWPEDILNSFDDMALKKCLVGEVHTPAFGGRGFYAICRRGTASRSLPPKVSVRSKTPCVRSTGWAFDSTLGFPGEGPENNAWITSKASLFTSHTPLFALHPSLLTPLSSHRFNGKACICGKEPPRTNERFYGAHSTVIIFRATRAKQKRYDNVSSETSA